jgi:hypothetical protein
VIPAPVRFGTDDGRYPLRSGATVGYVDRDAAPIVGRFCSELTRRTRLRLEPRAGKTEVDETSVTVELTTGDDSDVLPAPQGLSPRPLEQPRSLRSARPQPKGAAAC